MSDEDLQYELDDVQQGSGPTNSGPEDYKPETETQSPKVVTDPELIKQLEAKQPKVVTNPELIKQLDTNYQKTANDNMKPVVSAAVKDTLKQTPMYGAYETLRSVGGGMLGSAAGGIAGIGAGIGTALAGGTVQEVTDAADDKIKSVQKATAYQPTSEFGKTATKAINYIPEKISEGANWAGEHTSDVATKLGAPPEVAGAAGAAVNTGIQALTMSDLPKASRAAKEVLGDSSRAAGEFAASHFKNTIEKGGVDLQSRLFAENSAKVKAVEVKNGIDKRASRAQTVSDWMAQQSVALKGMSKDQAVAYLTSDKFKMGQARVIKNNKDLIDHPELKRLSMEAFEKQDTRTVGQEIKHQTKKGMLQPKESIKRAMINSGMEEGEANKAAWATTVLTGMLFHGPSLAVEGLTTAAGAAKGVYKGVTSALIEKPGYKALRSGLYQARKMSPEAEAATKTLHEQYAAGKIPKSEFYEKVGEIRANYEKSLEPPPKPPTKPRTKPPAQAVSGLTQLQTTKNTQVAEAANNGRAATSDKALFDKLDAMHESIKARTNGAPQLAKTPTSKNSAAVRDLSVSREINGPAKSGLSGLVGKGGEPVKLVTKKGLEEAAMRKRAGASSADTQKQIDLIPSKWRVKGDQGPVADHYTSAKTQLIKDGKQKIVDRIEKESPNLKDATNEMKSILKPIIPGSKRQKLIDSNSESAKSLRNSSGPGPLTKEEFKKRKESDANDRTIPEKFRNKGAGLTVDQMRQYRAAKIDLTALGGGKADLVKNIEDSSKNFTDALEKIKMMHGLLKENK